MKTDDRGRKIKRMVLSAVLLIVVLASVPDVRQMGRQLFLAFMHATGHSTTSMPEHPRELPPYNPGIVLGSPPMAVTYTMAPAPHQEVAEPRPPL